MNKKKSRGVIALCFMFAFGMGGIASAGSSALKVAIDSAEIIKLDKGVAEVFIANPEIADIQINNLGSAYIFGKQAGVTTLIVTDKNGQVLQNFSIEVANNLTQLNNLLKSAHGGEKVKAISSPTGVILRGQVSSPKVAQSLMDISEHFLLEGEEVVNQMTVAEPVQVYLKVKIAEVSRSVLNKLDINWDASMPAKKFLFGVLQGRNPLAAATTTTTATAAGTTSTTSAITNAFSRATTGTENFSSFGGQFSDGNVSISSLIDILNSEGLGTILAEPNLVTMSGETASFLAGGEFPFPVPQNQNITIEFKKFGVNLAFTPTVLSSDMINLKVNPEVSDLDYANSLQMPTSTDGSVVTIPAIKTRRVETSVQLGSGQSLAIAGLFSNKISNNLRQVPGLSSLPIIGAFFRSSRFERDETEMVVVVTPYIVDPSSKKSFKIPTDTLVYASGANGIMNGELNKTNILTQEQTGGHPDQSSGLTGMAGFHYD